MGGYKPFPSSILMYIFSLLPVIPPAHILVVLRLTSFWFRPFHPQCQYCWASWMAEPSGQQFIYFLCFPVIPPEHILVVLRVTSFCFRPLHLQCQFCWASRMAEQSGQQCRPELRTSMISCGCAHELDSSGSPATINRAYTAVCPACWSAPHNLPRRSMKNDVKFTMLRTICPECPLATHLCRFRILPTGETIICSNKPSIFWAIYPWKPGFISSTDSWY